MERFECPRAVWYITKLVDAQQLFNVASQENGNFVGVELKLDEKNWSVASKRYNSLIDAAADAGSILNSPERNSGESLLSLRMFYSLSKPKCRTNALNLARHECKACNFSFKERCAQPCAYVDPNDVQFSCYTNAQIAQNAKQTQDHFSRLAHYRQGDGTFIPVTAIQKIPDAPGQSLLKQALRVENGQPPTQLPNLDVLRPRFTVFNDRHYALIPPNARADRVPEKHRWPWGRQNNRLNLRQDNERPHDCIEDQFDVDIRQNGSWIDQHFSGQATREQFFLDIAVEKGVSKFDIVNLVNE